MNALSHAADSRYAATVYPIDKAGASSGFLYASSNIVVWYPIAIIANIGFKHNYDESSAKAA